MLIGRKVTVLGAGIAGLAVARALALRGAEVLVLEQAEAISEVGAGIQVSPNGAKVLEALGLWEAFCAVSLGSLGVDLRDGESGGLVAALPFGAQGPFRLVHRARLIEVLEAGAREAGVQIRLLQQVAQVDLSGARPRVTTEQGAAFETDLLIGADGLHSKLRAALNGPAAPFFTHQICWRALVPCGPEESPRAQVFMGAGRHLVSYPLGGGLRNIVAVEERNRWVKESYALQDDALTLRAAFEGFCPQVQGWLEQVEAPWLWGLFRHPVAERWGTQGQGWGAALLGDAAHPTLPFLAQGAVMALEDAWVLADLLARHETGEALARYQAIRRPRAAKIVEAANKNARNYHLSGLSRWVGQSGLKLASRLAPQQILRRYDWVYRHDVTKG